MFEVINRKNTKKSWNANSDTVQKFVKFIVELYEQKYDRVKFSVLIWPYSAIFHIDHVQILDPKFNFDLKFRPKFSFDVKFRPKFNFDVKFRPNFNFDLKSIPKFNFDLAVRPKFNLDLKFRPKVNCDLKFSPKFNFDLN